MSRPTKSDFEQWNPAVLSQRADAVKTVVDGLQHGADDSGAAQKSAANNFQGKAADAIGEQTTTNVASLGHFHDAAEGLRSAYANGTGKLTPSVNGLRDVLRDAQQKGFTVTDDWKLQDTQRPNMHRAEAQQQLQEKLSGALKNWDQARDGVKSDITKANQALYDTPMPKLGADYTPTPEQPPAQPDQPQPDDKQHDQGQPGDHVPGANGKPGDPGYVVPKAPGDPAESPYPPKDVNPSAKDTWKSDMPGADNPPGYPPAGPGAQRDQNWKDYLAGKNADGSPRPTGQMPAAYPNPEAVSDKGLKVIGAAARQQGTRYVWGGGGPNGTTQPGTRDGGYGDKMHDYEHRGFDCSGLVEYATYQATGYDPGKGSGTQFAQMTSGDAPFGSVVQTTTKLDTSTLRPGDIIYYDGKGGAASQHVAIYMGNGLTVETNTSGTPVHEQPVTTGMDGGKIRVVRPGG